MLKRVKNYPIIASLLVFMAFQSLLKWPGAFYLIILILMVILLAVRYICGYSYKQKKLWLHFLTLALLVSSVFLYLYFVKSNTLKQILIIGICFYHLFLLRSYFNYFRKINIHKSNLPNIINYTSLLSAFFFFTSFFALRIFMGFNLFWLIVFVLILVFILVLTDFKFQNISIKENYLYIIVMILLSLEIFWTIIFLPTHFLVNGFFLTLFFYVILNIMRLNILKELNNKTLFRYLSFGLASSLLIFLTAQWV
ncbi:MAG: hypothetical protein U5L76_02580 [Patescibacteria group bacterium]|nr:hypothetical protein [Patescibacteria group bacterium]